MKLEEYHALDRVEAQHWFYAGKRELALWWIERSLTLKKGDVILDAGAGTGKLVEELKSEYESLGVKVEGLEYEAEARNIAQGRRDLTLTSGSIEHLPYEGGSVSAAICLDVLEHIENDTAGLSELLRVCKVGGIVMINVPAFMSLWSEWDRSLGHHRRYTIRSFRELLRKQTSAFDVVYLGYTNWFAFLPIWLYRRADNIFHFSNRAEDNIPTGWLNTVLKNLYVGAAKMTWLRQPFGSSLFCVLRKQ